MSLSLWTTAHIVCSTIVSHHSYQWLGILSVHKNGGQRTWKDLRPPCNPPLPLGHSPSPIRHGPLRRLEFVIPVRKSSSYTLKWSPLSIQLLAFQSPRGNGDLLRVRGATKCRFRSVGGFVTPWHPSRLRKGGFKFDRLIDSMFGNYCHIPSWTEFRGLRAYKTRDGLDTRVCSPTKKKASRFVQSDEFEEIHPSVKIQGSR